MTLVAPHRPTARRPARKPTPQSAPNSARRRAEATPPRPLEVGTVGWTVDDLADPDVQRWWERGRYELVEGVVAELPPQGIGGVRPTTRLRRTLENRTSPIDPDGFYYNGVDLRLPDRRRVPRPDMLYLTAEQDRRQRELESERGIERGTYTPVLVTPLLIVKSLSVGHEDHDRRTKRAWYARAGVPHYWLLSDAERSLACLALDGKRYRESGRGVGSDVVPTEFFGLAVPLAEVWG